MNIQAILLISLTEDNDVSKLYMNNTKIHFIKPGDEVSITSTTLFSMYVSRA